MNTRPIVAASLAALLCVSISLADQTPPPTGTFSGEGLTLVLERDGDAYTGKATLNGHVFDLRGAFDPAKGLAGTFSSQGTTYEWSAMVEGATLKFRTGGTEYALAIPATPDNPLAKKPAHAPQENPLAKKPASGDTPSRTTTAAPPAGTLKLTRLSVKDPGINNIEAVSFLIPEGWRTEGGVQWFPNHSILANLLMTITDPKSGAQIQFLPLQNFTWLEQSMVPMQPGSNYMGNIVAQPVQDVPAFVRTFYAPQAMPQIQQARQVSAEALPKIAEQVSQAYGGQSQVVAGKVRYEYERAGKPWEEDVFVTLVFAPPMQGIHIWSVGSAYSFRAPKGELDRVEPLMTTVVSTARLSLDWYGGYMYVQQLFMNRMNQGIASARAISDTVTRNSEEIRKMFGDSYRQRQESQDRINRNFSEYIRGVETYTNPYENRPVQLPSGYQNAWVNAQGEYLLSTQTGFDPNVGTTTEWRKMDAAP